MLGLNRIVWLLIFLMLPACQELDPKVAFFRQPHDTWLEAVTKMPVEQQYEYYIYGMQNVRPPAMHLKIPLANNAQQSAPIVMKHLARTKNRDEVDAIGYIITFMYSAKGVNLCENKEYRDILMDRYGKNTTPHTNEILDMCVN